LSTAIKACLDRANRAVRYSSIYLACLPKGGYEYVSSHLPDTWMDMNDDDDIVDAWKSLEPDQRSYVFREFESVSALPELLSRKDTLVGLIEKFVTVKSPKRTVSNSSSDSSSMEFPEVWVPFDQDGDLRLGWGNLTRKERAQLTEISQDPDRVKSATDVRNLVREMRKNAKKSSGDPSNYVTRTIREVLSVRLDKQRKKVHLLISYGPKETDKEWVDAKTLLSESIISLLRSEIIRTK
jgi:hypothetical protein